MWTIRPEHRIFYFMKRKEMKNFDWFIFLCIMQNSVTPTIETVHFKIIFHPAIYQVDIRHESLDIHISTNLI